jgi:hypothetical protein
MGFVSNSSSSSFCIYGLEKGEDEFAKLLGLSGYDEDFDGDYDAEYERYEKFEEALRKALEGTCLTYEFGEGYGYVGMSWSKVGDKETGLQFKQKVEADIEKAFGQKLNCATHEGEICTG